MATKKKSSPKARTRARATTARTRDGAGARLRETWDATVEALGSAEAQAEKQLRRLLARNKISPADARTALAAFRARVQKQRGIAAREIEARLSTLQGRLQQERKNVGHALTEAVRGTLAAFNIPSRREVSELTRKVDELTRKIDVYRKAPAPRRRRTSTAAGR
jgi:5-carboxymethyl-2-hydroxymuconate isomerase